MTEDSQGREVCITSSVSPLDDEAHACSFHTAMSTDQSRVQTEVSTLTYLRSALTDSHWLLHDVIGEMPGAIRLVLRLTGTERWHANARKLWCAWSYFLLLWWLASQCYGLRFEVLDFIHEDKTWIRRTSRVANDACNFFLWLLHFVTARTLRYQYAPGPVTYCRPLFVVAFGMIDMAFYVVSSDWSSVGFGLLVTVSLFLQEFAVFTATLVLLEADLSSLRSSVERLLDDTSGEAHAYLMDKLKLLQKRWGVFLSLHITSGLGLLVSSAANAVLDAEIAYRQAISNLFFGVFIGSVLLVQLAPVTEYNTALSEVQDRCTNMQVWWRLENQPLQLATCNVKLSRNTFRLAIVSTISVSAGQLLRKIWSEIQQHAL